MKIFNLDSPVMVFLSKVANLMILNVLTIICCIPIFTVGASITALYYVTLKMVKDEDPYIVKGYFKSFKQNFRQATIIWLIMLLVIFVMVADWRVVINAMTGNVATFMRVVLLFVSILMVFTALYIFPVLSRFENSVKNTIRNAFLMSFMNLPKSVMIVLIHLLPVALVLLTMQSLPFIFMLGVSTVAFISSMVFVKIFKRFEPEEEAVNEEELAPLSFIVEEEKAKQEEKERQEAIAAQEALSEPPSQES